MEFGIAFKGDMSMDRTIALCRQAEVRRLRLHLVLRLAHPLVRSIHAASPSAWTRPRRLRFGPLVTNPKVRDWSVNASMWATLLEISDGRFDLGVGQG